MKEYFVGTNIFICIGEALSYYKEFGYDVKGVRELISTKAIEIGFAALEERYPENVKNRKYRVDEDGRFQIIVSENRVQ